jgi:hypothetical protein
MAAFYSINSFPYNHSILSSPFILCIQPRIPILSLYESELALRGDEGKLQKHLVHWATRLITQEMKWNYSWHISYHFTTEI